ncbi:hypothetical protein ACLKA6_004848 [Drosophila palustris]
MQLRRQAPVTLTTLNDDCLLLICAQVPIREQFTLMQLGGRLRQLVLQIWRRKYADEFDWQLSPQLKWLSANEQSQLLGHMAGITKALLHLDASAEGLQTWLTEEGNRQRLTNLQRISFTDCNSRLLQQLSGIVGCHSLVQLQLGTCVDVTAVDLVTLFGQPRQLKVFELLPGGRWHNSSCICSGDVSVLANIEYCHTLHCLKLPSCALRAAAVRIARLPQLRQLTGFLCCSRDIDDDKGKEANAAATISACLTALNACQIVALNLQCQLDGSLLRMLQGHSRELQLRRFAWHSQLMVHYDATDGSIKWMPQQPQVARDILHFIVSQAASLHELDFTRNVHATPTFLAQLDEYFFLNGSHQLGQPRQLAVWHDGCPSPNPSPSFRPQVSEEKENQHTNVNSNDLAFVDFELKQCINSVVVPDALLIALNRYLDDQQDRNAAATRQVQVRAEGDSGKALCNCDSTMRSNSIKGAAAEQTLGAIPKSTLAPQQLVSQGNSRDIRQQHTHQQVWNSTELSPKTFDTQFIARRRSRSAPTEGFRDCQRGADKFCRTPQPNPHNFMGLQPSESSKLRKVQATESNQRPQPKVLRCSNCCGSGPNNNNSFQMGNMSLEPSGHMDGSSRPGMNYDQWYQQQHQQQRPQQQYQQQQQYQPQQPQQQHWQQSSGCLRNEASFDDFEPVVNSTMIDQDYQGNAGHSRQCSPQQQQHQQFQSQASYRSQYGQNQSQAYGACCMPQQPPMSATSQGQYSSQQRVQYPPDLDNSYNEASYVVLPQNPQGMQKSTSVSFRDDQLMSTRQTARTTAAYPPGSGYQSNSSMNQGPHYQETTVNNSGFNQSNLSQTINLTKSNTSCQDTTNPDKPNRPITPINYMTHEELYVHRAQAVFFENLVMDRTCPGVIQDSLDGRDNFNEYAFQIAFGDKVPNEPHPIDPMTMLEAIKMRIDYEREEIHKKCPTVRDESDRSSRRNKNKNSRLDNSRDRSRRSAERDKDSYYYKSKEAKKRRGSTTELTAQELMSEDIDRHFSTKNKSEVNDSILAFLKAENDYSTTPGHSSKNFSANVNSHESNFLGLPIKMRIYNATTWPTD